MSPRPGSRRPPPPGVTRKTTYERRVEAHLCRRCAAPLADGEVRVECEACREKARRYGREFRASNPDHWVWRRYGITMAEWRAMFTAQGGRCAICGRADPHGRGWSTDHDHATGQVRGILCHPCNAGLGHYGDNPDMLTRAARYLRLFKPKAQRKQAGTSPQLALIQGGRLGSRQ